jgi:N6-L-threonylcarbamoyladenine synthase
MLGLPYPGGPALSKLAVGGNPYYIDLPRPLIGEKTADFSFSGLKTALKYALRDRGGVEALSQAERKDIAASYEQAICLHLLAGIRHALDVFSDVQEFHLVGGVSANRTLRNMCEQLDVPCRLPAKMEYCTDNAAMIACAGYFLHKEKGDAAFEPVLTEASCELILK